MTAHTHLAVYGGQTNIDTSTVEGTAIIHFNEGHRQVSDCAVFLTRPQLERLRDQIDTALTFPWHVDAAPESAQQ